MCVEESLLSRKGQLTHLALPFVRGCGRINDYSCDSAVGIVIRCQFPGHCWLGSLMSRWAILRHSPGPPHGHVGLPSSMGTTVSRRIERIPSLVLFAACSVTSAEGQVPSFLL